MSDPIFISGLRKSGTSLVKNLFDGHPELFVFPPNEVHFFRHTPHPSIVKDKARSKDIKEDPKELLKILAESRFIQRMGDPSSEDFRISLSLDQFQREIALKDPKDLREVYVDLFSSMKAAVNVADGDFQVGERFLSKTVLDTEFFPILKSYFPDLKFVYVLRNPYGHFVAARNSLRKDAEKNKDGLSKKNRYPYIKTEVERMKNSFYFMEKFQFIFPDNFKVLVYDELLKNPEKELKDICSFLGIEYSSDLLFPTILGEPWGGNSWFKQDFDGIDKSPLDHWKDDITYKEIKVLNHHFSDIIEEYFEKLEGGGGILKKLHPSEDLKTFVKNKAFHYVSVSDF